MRRLGLAGLDHIGNATGKGCGHIAVGCGDCIEFYRNDGKTRAPSKSRRGSFVLDEFWHMSQWTRRMVETFVRSRNRQALDDLWLNRKSLIASFNTLSGHDLRKVVAGLEEEMAIIEAAINKLEQRSVA
jgi:hypothetical protein